MDRKGVYRTKKRKFKGNRYTASTSDEANMSNVSTSSKKLKLNRPRPTSPKPNLGSPVVFSESSKDPTGNRIIDLEQLGLGLKNSLSCKVCGGDVYLSETNIRGLGSKITIQCEQCEPSNIGEFHTSKIVDETNQTYEVNRRFVYSMRSIGQGLSSLKKFCAIMNLPAPVAAATYNLINKQILQATKSASSASMQEAVIEEKMATDTEPNTDITVSGDGTWLTRGHKSLMGVCSVIGANCSKVLDVEVLSSFCHGCNVWKGPKQGAEYEAFVKIHKESGKCSKNHFGSAGNMEVEGMKNIFHRSENHYGVRYTNYIGDGDTSTYRSLVASKPYGPDVTIVKEECIGHIQKRMSTRLRKLKKENKGKLLSDGKLIGGKNRLTDSTIDQLSVYYGNAIRANTDDLTKMRMAIWTTWKHKASSDENPMHHFCPVGPNSWCKYQVAQSTNTIETFKHKNTIPLSVMEYIKPIFLDLSKPELLRRCLKGKTQNANESYNSVLWSFCPKRGFAGKTVVEIAAYEAALVYNEGSLAKLKVLQHLKVVPGKHCEIALRKLDVRRVVDAEIKAKKDTLEARRARRRLRLENQSKFEEKEGPTYEAGAF